MRGQQAASPAFPVVAIGTSAGGLEALELFLRKVPAKSGMAFVIVQHLDPTRKGMLVELLASISPIPVIQVSEGMRVLPDHAYVIPPNKDMSIEAGALHLVPPTAPRGQRLPIDVFFRSLAEEMGSHGIGVVLSGMGADGTLGLRAIREASGSAFAQEPSSAKFDAMPRSAIDSGVVDVVAPAQQLPAKIVDYIVHAHVVTSAPHSAGSVAAETALEQILDLLREVSGHDFTPYKTSTILRRIERRVGLHKLGNLERYVSYLRDNPGEIELLFHELLIGVTSFFRDAGAWDVLASRVLDRLVASRATSVVRAWVPACSTGEEAYSLAICFKEALDRAGASPRDLTLQVFATDLDEHAIARARRGGYSTGIAEDVSGERLKRFFVEEGKGYRVRKEVRELVVFAKQDLLQDPPFTRLDILCCRNVLIYLTADAQQSLLPVFHYSLNRGAALFLGSSETIGGLSSLFAPIDSKARLYRRIGGLGVVPTAFPSSQTRGRSGAPDTSANAAARGSTSSAQGLKSAVNALLLERFSPASVLVSRDGDVLFVSGRTAKYLEVPAGQTNWNIVAMARDGLRHALASALDNAVRGKKTVTLRDVDLGALTGSRSISITIHPMEDPPLRGTFLVVFADAARALPETAARGKPATVRGGAQKLVDRELGRVREELRATREEAQAASEELRSTNEELQSTNEELQSTNEELTTSKEEMQSMNEELQTLNAELQARVDALSEASNDMKNLLDSTAIAVLFLDERFNVRRFTPEAAKIIRLIPSDVGRPLTDLATTLDYGALYDDAREVLSTLASKETVVDTLDGRRFAVRIMPYRTSDNRIDGVVVTFICVPRAVPDAAPTSALS